MMNLPTFSIERSMKLCAVNDIFLNLPSSTFGRLIKVMNHACLIRVIIILYIVFCGILLRPLLQPYLVVVIVINVDD